MVSVRKLYLLPGIFTNGGFELLGSFVGSLSFCESSDLMRVEKIQAMLVLRDFHDSHGNHSPVILSCSLKIPFALCTCALDLIQAALAAFDDIMREALSDVA